LILACVAIGEIAPETQDRSATLLDSFTKEALEVCFKFRQKGWSSLADQFIPAIVIPARSPARWRYTNIDRLVNALHDEDYNVRVLAAQALGRLGSAANEAVIPGLLAALRDDHDHVRWRAAKALGGLGSAANEAVISGLLAALRDDDDGVRLRAAGALGGLGSAANEAVISALLAALRDDDYHVRGSAAEALAVFMKSGLRVFINQPLFLWERRKAKVQHVLTLSKEM
ncbi:MAG: HEAT repeat domain-containing protein, partial [Methylococcales bacterium]